MPFFSHAVAGAAIAWTFSPCRYRRTLTVLGAAVAVLPDADIVSLELGAEYAGLLGHRGVTHSLAFAAVVAFAAALLWSRWSRFPRARLSRVTACLFAAAASHPILDALSGGGLGVAFLAPFSAARWFFPYTPIRVVPVIPEVILSLYGFGVFLNEVVWVWLPAAAMIIAGALVRRRSGCTGTPECACGLARVQLATVPPGPVAGR